MKLKLMTSAVLTASVLMVSSNAHALSMAEILAAAFAGPSATSVANNPTLATAQQAVVQNGTAQDQATNPTGTGSTLPGGAGGNSLLDNILQQQQATSGIKLPVSLL